MVNINRILCPVDLSAYWRDALHHALALASWYESQVTVLHVYNAPQPLLPVTGAPGNVPLPVQGKGPFHRLVSGSPTHHVIREAECPVLTICGGLVLASHPTSIRKASSVVSQRVHSGLTRTGSAFVRRSAPGTGSRRGAWEAGER
jgi:hypothetical protein